jgi:hypothetical protein
MFEGFFFAFSAFKENVIEGDGPKNQTQSNLCKQFIDLQLVKSFQICNLIFTLKLTL